MLFAWKTSRVLCIPFGCELAKGPGTCCMLFTKRISSVLAVSAFPHTYTHRHGHTRGPARGAVHQNFVDTLCIYILWSIHPGAVLLCSAQANMCVCWCRVGGNVCCCHTCAVLAAPGWCAGCVSRSVHPNRSQHAFIDCPSHRGIPSTAPPTILSCIASTQQHSRTAVWSAGISWRAASCWCCSWFSCTRNCGSNRLACGW